LVVGRSQATVTWDPDSVDDPLLSRAQVAWLIVTAGWSVIGGVWLATGRAIGWIGLLIAIGSGYRLFQAE
jgi:hypothetical protein